MFPFLILVTALASFFGSASLADEAADLILEAWPTEVGEPIAAEVHRVLTEQRRDILTIGAAVDLESEGLRRLFVNAIYWGLGMEDKILPKANVDYVGEFHPAFFGFGKFKRGLKPSDFELK